MQSYVSELYQSDPDLKSIPHRPGWVEAAWLQHGSVAHMWGCLRTVNGLMHDHTETDQVKRFTWGTLTRKGYNALDPEVRSDWNRRVTSLRLDPLRDEDDASLWLSTLWVMELIAEAAEESRVWRPADQVWRAPPDLPLLAETGYTDPGIERPPAELVERAHRKEAGPSRT